jgi:hypothetical protein
MPRQFSQPAITLFAACCRALARFALIVVGVLGASGPSASAQCTPGWLPGEPSPGLAGLAVTAMTHWDPDGSGPQPPRLVVGGSFQSVGNVAASNIAVLDPATGAWSALGTGIDGFGQVLALLALPNGDLVAGGSFAAAGGTGVSNIARWNGSSWSALGSGIGAPYAETVRALVLLPNGDLVAGGNFAYHVARWNGSVWSPIGTGFNFGGTVHGLTVLPNGDLVVGGQFASASGIAADNIARWNGSTWSTFGSGTNGPVYSFAELPNGDLVAGGTFTAAGGVAANSIARWNGSNWSPLGGGMPGSSAWVPALATLPNGDLVAGGSFITAGGVIANNIARWNGSSWTALGGGLLGGSAAAATRAIAVLANGELIVGGQFQFAGSIASKGIARWSGSSWHPIGFGVSAPMEAMVVLPNGELVAGGGFTTAGGVAVNQIARWNGSTWTTLGSGLGVLGDSVQALAVMHGGDLAAGGRFAGRIARWNGSLWSPLGSGMDDAVAALVVLPNGDLVAGGQFTLAGGTAANRIARWNGSAWSALGSGMDSAVSALAVLPNGDLVAAGGFSTAGGAATNRIARWNGSTWSALGSGMNGGVISLAVLPNGDLVAGGNFTIAGGVAASAIARWDGSVWSALDSGVSGAQGVLVNAMAVLPNGDLVVGGTFTQAGGAPANHIARWDGKTWSPLGSGIGGAQTNIVHCLAVMPSGELLAGGQFGTAGSQTSAYFARYATPCPATVTAYGSGCVGAAGVLALTAVNTPWTGTTFRARGTGMPALGVIGSVFGFTTESTPLASVLPGSLPGCILLAHPDASFVLLPFQGIAESELWIPNQASLAGMVVHHQLVAFEINGLLQFGAITATNALRLTLGSL